MKVVSMYKCLLDVQDCCWIHRKGEYEKGVDHLTNAIAVCGQPQQLLQVLQQTLPPPVFQMLLTKLPTISQGPSVPASVKVGSEFGVTDCIPIYIID
ncbi:hypothetical protein CB1_000713012 [Camelus ferus]|nr:hypothetical protein CB1_000713012 [Camelus ferus]